MLHHQLVPIGYISSKEQKFGLVTVNDTKNPTKPKKPFVNYFT